MTPKTVLRIYLFLVGCTLCSAFAGSKRNQHTSNKASDNVLDVLVAEPDLLATGLRRVSATAAAFLVATAAWQEPSVAVQPTLNEAIVEVSETSYPILRALDPTAFSAFSEKIGDTLLKINPDKLGKSIELAIDALDSAPSDKIADFNSLLKEAYADTSPDTCSKVPLPPMTTVDKFAAVASDKVDAAKLKTFQDTWNPALETLNKVKTADGAKICLPPSRGALDKLSLAQADLARSFGKDETKAFAKYATPIVKSAITPGKALSFVNDAKTLAPMATPQAKKDFANAGKKVEQAASLEQARQKIADQKAKQAATRAAMAK